MFEIILFAALAFPAAAPAPVQTLQVRHDHDPWGSCTGEVEISETGIEFRSDKEEHSRNWPWIDIQSFDRLSSRRFSVLTWEDQKWKLGLDRYYDFTVLPEGDDLTGEAFEKIRQSLKGSVTDRIPASVDFEYAVPVKHLHTFGGCEGQLRFGREWIVYETEEPFHSRTWRRREDVESVWSANRYQLEIHVFEENQREFEKTKRYRFQLKEPLDADYYEKLRRDTVAFW